MKLLKRIRDTLVHQKDDSVFVGYILYGYNRYINNPEPSNISFEQYLDDIIKRIRYDTEPLDHKVNQTGFYYHEYRTTPTVLSKATTKLKKHQKLTKQESQAILNKLEQIKSGVADSKTSTGSSPKLPNRAGTPMIVGCYSIYGDDVYFNDQRIGHNPNTKPMQILRYLLKSSDRTASKEQLATELQCRNNPDLVKRNIDHLKNQLKPFYGDKRNMLPHIKEKPLIYKLLLPEELEYVFVSK